MNKEKILKAIKDTGIIAVMRGMEREKTKKVADAIVKGGIKVLEITMNSSQPLKTIEEIRMEFEGTDIVVGAGTVLDSESARSAMFAGAEFIVSPSLSEKVIEICNRYSIPVIPGVMTPTEIVKGLELGADLLKVFPADVLGPRFIKDILGPIKYAKFVPTGGINLSNVAEYIKAGAYAVGAGGGLMRKELIENNRYEELTKLAEEFIGKIREARR